MMDRKILICSNPYRDGGNQIAKMIFALLKEDGQDCEIVELFTSGEKYKVETEMAELIKSAKLLIAIGGDGTFLHVARTATAVEVPVIGVNTGSKGFLAEVEINELDLLKRAANGEFRESHRVLLDVELWRDGNLYYKEYALNDAVIKSDVNLIGIKVDSDDREMMSFWGDGVIIATPTGSTAYSMSAGGPIIEPEAKNILITPICAHAMAAKSFVLSPMRKLDVSLERLRDRRAMLSVDGAQPIELRADDKVKIKIYEKELIVADVAGKSFFELAKDKLTRSQ